MENTMYTPLNANDETRRAEHRKQKEIYAVSPDTNKAYTNEELEQKMNEAGVDASGMGDYSQKGEYRKDGSDGILPGTGEKGWGYYEGKPRPVAEGTSGADEDHLSDSEYAYVQYCKQMYAQAATQADKDYWHSEAEKVRARHGYIGGTDGSGYYTLGSLGVTDGAGAAGGNDYAGTEPSGTSGGGGNSSAGDMQSLLNAWQQAALKQSEGKTDYAVQQGVAELERALADAQPQFKEQAESVDRNARQAMDNSALYAELRGDKGGIGQEQYNSIQNTQAQNHLSVQQAQTKLATDTKRQIADLRAQGEFEKADAALEITQTYLAQLISLEQWAAEYDLSVEQFQASLRQWEAEYDMAMQKLRIGQKQWQQEFDYAKYRDEQDRLGAIGEALLSAGIPLTSEQMAAMKITEEQAEKLLAAQRAQSASGATGKGEGEEVVMDYDGLFAAAKESGHAKSFIANNYKKYGFTSTTGLYDEFEVWSEQSREREEKAIRDASKLALGLGAIHDDAVMGMVIAGMLEIEGNGAVRWADGWDAERFKKESRHKNLLEDVLA